jgi:hypothetical protein
MSTPPEPPTDPWATPPPGGQPPSGRSTEPYFDSTSDAYPAPTAPGGAQGGPYPTSYAPYGAPAGQYGPAYGSPAPASAGNGLGTAALILGILAVVSGVFLIGAVFGIVAIVLGLVGRGRARRGQATNGGAALAGTLLGLTGVLIAVSVIVFVFALFAGPISDYRQCLDRAGSDPTAQQVCGDQLRNRFSERFR